MFKNVSSSDGTFPTPDVELASESETRSSESGSSDFEAPLLEEAVLEEHEIKKEQSRWLEDKTDTFSKLAHLGFWLLLNLALTLSNKAVIQLFPFPWLLTCLQCTASALGAWLMYLRGAFPLSELSQEASLEIYAFSTLFTANIAISNLSLAFVSIPFHQVMRAMGPVFTVIIQLIIFRRSYSIQTYSSSVIIILGVGMVTFGDYEFTILGFCLTLLGVILAAVKGIVTNHLLTRRLALPPLELLLRLSPLAALQCAVIAIFTNEASRLLESAASKVSLSTGTALLGNSLAAFLLNVVSFRTNKRVGPLTMAVGGNVKQCLTILIGAVLFHVTITPLYGAGLLVVVMGAAWYSRVEIQHRNSKP